MIHKNEFIESVLIEAVDKWGQESQIQVAFGECGEFVALAGRRAQGRATDEDMVDEIADVIVMMMQMRRIYGSDNVDKRIGFKIARLKERLDKV